LMAIDAEHRPLTPIILWSDTRGGEIAARIRQSAMAEGLYRATGAPMHSMLPLCKIIWLKENAPDVFKKAARFISIKEYLWHRLFGVFEIDASIAGATGLYDLETK